MHDIFLSKFKLNYPWKMCGYPQFSFWILLAFNFKLSTLFHTVYSIDNQQLLLALAKICFFHVDI